MYKCLYGECFVSAHILLHFLSIVKIKNDSYTLCATSAAPAVIYMVPKPDNHVFWLFYCHVVDQIPAKKEGRFV